MCASTTSASSRARSVITSFIRSARLSAAEQRGRETSPHFDQACGPVPVVRGPVERPIRLETLSQVLQCPDDQALVPVRLLDPLQVVQRGTGPFALVDEL